MADTPVGTPTTPAPAAGDELHIPKHRFDEVAQEVRRLREELSVKDQLFMQSQRAQMQPPSPGITAEDLGIDPQTFKAIEIIADKKFARERAGFEQQIGMLAGRTEKAELLATKGSGAAKYLPEIQAKQQEHYQRTGGFLPAEIALTMIQDREKDERIRQLEARLAAGGAHVPPAAAAPTPPSAPGAAGTRQMPGGGETPKAAGSFGELTVEEMEARLEEQLKAGDRF